MAKAPAAQVHARVGQVAGLVRRARRSRAGRCRGARAASSRRPTSRAERTPSTMGTGSAFGAELEGVHVGARGATLRVAREVEERVAVHGQRRVVARRHRHAIDAAHDVGGVDANGDGCRCCACPHRAVHRQPRHRPPSRCDGPHAARRPAGTASAAPDAARARRSRSACRSTDPAGARPTATPPRCSGCGRRGSRGTRPWRPRPREKEFTRSLVSGVERLLSTL